jgi:hypothetical protein
MDSVENDAEHSRNSPCACLVSPSLFFQSKIIQSLRRRKRAPSGQDRKLIFHADDVGFVVKLIKLFHIPNGTVGRFS